jgi:hypothetical protein
VQTAAIRGSNPFSLILDQSPMFCFLPPAWFAGAIAVTLGDRSGRAIGLSLAALSLLIFVVWIMLKGVPGGYLRLLTTHTLEGRSDSDPPESSLRANGARPGLEHILHRMTSKFRSAFQRFPPSTQSSYQLVSRYLKRDARLRRGIYPFFGIIIFYFIYAIENPNFVTDIFQVSSALDVLSTHPAYILLPLCVLIATNATQYCSDWRAAWILRTAPIECSHFHLGYRLATFRNIGAPIWLLSCIFYSF